MHDPDVQVFSIPRPWPTRVNWGKIRWYWPPVVTIWHTEPGGHDSGTICKGMQATRFSWRNALWAVRHIRHIRAQVIPLQRARQYFDRCAGCHQRMRRCARFGYMSSDDVYHDWCMSLQSVRSQLDDFKRYVRGDADSNERFRVEYWLKNNPPDSLEGLS